MTATTTSTVTEIVPGEDDCQPSTAAVAPPVTDDDCGPCTHAALHGWWGPMGRNRTHCRKCHRSWASLREIHCVTCHRHFANPVACDAHQTGEEGCSDPHEVVRADGKPKFAEVDHGRGPVFKLAFYGKRPTFDD